MVFTTVAVALTLHWLFPELPLAACAALGAIVSPPDAVSARAVLQRVRLPRRVKILLEGESLLNDASGLVLFRFAVAAVVSSSFSAASAIGEFCLLALGGAVVGAIIGTLWVKLVRRLDDEYLIIASLAVLSWVTYIAAERLHVSGVIATVTTGIVARWHAHTALSASTRMRGYGYWTVAVFLSWAGVRGVVTLALALSVPEGFPGRDVILVTAFVVILGTVLLQATTFERVINWAKLTEDPKAAARLNLGQAELAMAEAQVDVVRKVAFAEDGTVVHPQLLEQFELRGRATASYAERPEEATPRLHAHFDLVLSANDDVLRNLERDLDLAELTAIAQKTSD